MAHRYYSRHFQDRLISGLRISLGLIFFWFGALKIIDASPANSLVAALLEQTLPFISLERFRALFGIYEIIIAAAFIIPRAERVAIALLIPHMFVAFLPLVVLSDITWQSTLVPTLEGQYIIKNLVIVALALSIAAQLHPLRKARNPKSEIRKKKK
jgi:uncharacterized membrane protein YkgB